MEQPPSISRWASRKVIEQTGWGWLESRRKAERNLRVVFWIYTVLLLAGTHYPKLQIGTPGDSPDKLIHFAAFGGWSMLFWLTGYVRSMFLVMVIGVLFGFLDEATQAIPGLGRTFDLGDVLANSMGAIIIPAWIHVFRPTNVPGEVVRVRDMRRSMALHRLLASPANLVHLGLAGALGSMMIGVLMIVVLGRTETVGPVTSAIIGAGIGSGVGVIIGTVIGFQAMLHRVNLQENGPGSTPPSGPAWRGGNGQRLIIRWVVIGLSVVVAVGLAAWLLGMFIPRAGVILNRYQAWGVNMAVVVDIGFFGGLAAWIGRRIRVDLARLDAAANEERPIS